MKRLRTPAERHALHDVEVRPGKGPHPAQLWCRRCQKHVQWITRAQADLLKGNSNDLQKN